MNTSEALTVQLVRTTRLLRLVERPQRDLGAVDAEKRETTLRLLRATEKRVRAAMELAL